MSEAFPFNREEQGFPRAEHVERRAQGGQEMAGRVVGQTACWVDSSRPRILLPIPAFLCTCEELGQPL